MTRLVLFCPVLSSPRPSQFRHKKHIRRQQRNTNFIHSAEHICQPFTELEGQQQQVITKRRSMWMPLIYLTFLKWKLKTGRPPNCSYKTDMSEWEWSGCSLPRTCQPREGAAEIKTQSGSRAEKDIWLFSIESKAEFKVCIKRWWSSLVYITIYHFSEGLLSFLG